MAKPDQLARQEGKVETTKQDLLNELKNVRQQLFDMTDKVVKHKEAASMIPGFQYGKSETMDNHAELLDREKQIIEELRSLGVPKREWSLFEE